MEKGRQAIGVDMPSFLGVGAERKERMQQAVCYHSVDKTG